MFSLSAAKLVSDGKLKWEDPIDSHLTDWKLADLDASKNMKIKHAACACTGMPRRDLDFIFQIEGISAEDHMATMADMKPTTKPGETFQYSNHLVAAGGYATALAIYPKMDLSSAYESAMKEFVFAPLGMRKTLITQAPPYTSDSAFPHSRTVENQSSVIPLQLEKFANNLAPAGSAWSTVDDMIKYLELELTKGRSIPGYIDEEQLLKRRERGVKINSEVNYGLGLIIETYKGLEIVSHGGNTLGFTSDLFFLPKHNIGVVILTNMGSANVFTSVVREELLKLLFKMNVNPQEKIVHSNNERVKSLKIYKDKIIPKISGMNKLVGSYQSKHLGDMRIYTKDDKLYADFGEFKTELKEIQNEGKRVFSFYSAPWTGSFEIIYDGNDFILDNAQQKYVFKRFL